MNETRKEVYERLMQLWQILGRHQMQNFQNFGPFQNPHRGQGRVLSMLKMKPEISQKELSYLLDMRKQSLAELLSKLEKSGYIVREQSEDDKRVSNIKLTEKGMAAAEEMDDDTQDLTALLDCLNDEELKQFSDYLERIIKHFNKELMNDDAFAERQKALEEFMQQHGDRFGGERGRFPFGDGHFGGRPDHISHPHGDNPFDFFRGFGNKRDDNSGNE